MLETQPQGIARLRFPVSHIDAPRWHRTLLRPFEQLAGIGMCGQRLQLNDRRTDRHLLAMDAHLIGARGEIRPTGSRSLESAQQHQIARIADEALEVMNDAPAGGHPARGRMIIGPERSSSSRDCCEVVT